MSESESVVTGGPATEREPGLGAQDGSRRIVYSSPFWLPGAHAQTIYPALMAPRPVVTYERERWAAPDGDFVDVDVCADSTHERPFLLVFHGLEGCSRSHYALAACRVAQHIGWGAAVVHFRGCSGEPNLAPRAYHSGDSEELQWILETAASRWPRRKRIALGVSLGGNVLLKWLGERGDDAGRLLSGAVSVSPPHDLEAGARSLASGFNRMYALNFLRSLKRKSLAKLAQFPGLFDREKMLDARDFFDFDDAVTAPIHGFQSCYDYWNRSSCRQFLPGVRVPTLIVNAQNDPFLPASALPAQVDVSAYVQLAQPQTGGHVGFFDGRKTNEKMPLFATQLLDWLSDHTDVHTDIQAASR